MAFIWCIILLCEFLRFFAFFLGGYMFEVNNDNWLEILDFFKNEYDISDAGFQTFIEPLQFKSYKDGLITLVFTGPTGAKGINYVNKKYVDFLKVSVFEITKQDVTFKITLPTDEDSVVDEVVKSNSSLDLRIEESNLDPKYTFDTFVVGSNNNAASVTAITVAEAPGEIYNPLYIYGGVGLGKTHILHAIGNYVLKHNKNAKVLYTTSEDFVNEVINLLGRTNKATQEDFQEFRTKYREADVLLIDDIQFFSKKDRCQEELFNIFNELHRRNKQIVITSDRLPREIKDISDRLVNRFEMGLSVDMKNPDYETRMAILKSKASNSPINIPDEVFDYIANNFTSNVRELEGTLNKIDFYAKLNNTSEIDLNFAKSTLKEMIPDDSNKKITCEYIIDVVADHYNIPVSDITSRKRSSNIAWPRQICMYLCSKHTDETQESIAYALNKDNHATISYACKKVTKEIKNNKETAMLIEQLEKKIL